MKLIHLVPVHQATLRQILIAKVKRQITNPVNASIANVIREILTGSIILMTVFVLFERKLTFNVEICV